MGKIKDFVLHEARLVALVTLYFITCFGLIGILKRLFLAEYEVRPTAAGGAIIAALVMAKVVIVLDKTPLGNRFERHAVWSSVLYKSTMYSLVAGGVLVLEKLFHAYHANEPWGAAIDEALRSADGDRALATTICLFVSFVGYNLLSEVGRSFGWDKLLAWLFTRHDKNADPAE